MTARALATMAPHLIEPFSIGRFRFTSTGVEVNEEGGRPSFTETQSAFDFTTRAVKHSGFWLTDMIAYIESRTEWGDRRDILISHETGLTEASVNVYRSIGKNVPPANRVEGVGFGHHAVVQKLDGQEQREWLTKSKTEGWTRKELQSELRNAKRTRLIAGTAPGVYRIEVVLVFDVEAPSVVKAEATCQGAVERMVKGIEAPLLHATIAHVRPR